MEINIEFALSLFILGTILVLLYMLYIFLSKKENAYLDEYIPPCGGYYSINRYKCCKNNVIYENGGKTNIPC
tara:strand:+ start:400 stop:615 length:216 start_codon:yes stop_codon:yes gene_type:complete